ncbi:putative diacylglycerol kinase [Ixodes scapularis]
MQSVIFEEIDLTELSVAECSTKNANHSFQVCVKEGSLLKQTSSFQRWKKRYFRLKPRKLYYAKDSKSVIFEEIDLTELSVAECSTKNANHSFQIITPFRRLILCAETRKEMEDWISALKSVCNKDFYEGTEHQQDFLSGQHNWYVTSHARPTYCNVCKEALSGVTSHGLSCEVCKFKAHKRCAVKSPSNCKWTTLASVGKDIIEDEDGTLTMPHQWMEGNLPVSAKCNVCDRTCGSVLRLQDWRCLWCRATFAEKRKRLQRRSQQQLPSPVAEGASLTPSADDVQGDGGGPGHRGASTPALSLSPNSDANVSQPASNESVSFNTSQSSAASSASPNYCQKVGLFESFFMFWA